MKPERDLQAGAADLSHDAIIVGYLNADAMMRGFVNAFIDALRTQVPASHLPGHAVFRGGRTVANIEAVKNEAAELMTQAAKAHQLAERAVDLVVRAETAEEESSYKRKAAGYRAEHARLVGAAEALTAATTARVSADPFDAYTSVLVPAMRRLATCGNRVSQEEYQALSTIVRDLRFEHREGQWWGSAVVRVNTRTDSRFDGVTELGPIEWCAGGRRNGRKLHQAASSAMRPDRVEALSMRLEATGRLTAKAARLALLSPHAEVPYLLLHALGGEDLPEFVDPDWTRPEFVAHIAATYQQGDDWLGGHLNNSFSPAKQAVLYYAEKRDVFTLDELIADLHLGVLPSVVSLLAIADLREKSSIRRRQPLIEVLEGPECVTPSTSARGVRCRCGRVAAVAARLPEVPADLLCGCGLMPRSEEHGMDPALRFPAAYLTRLPEEECLASVKARWENYKPRQTGRLLLLALVGEPDGRLDRAGAVAVAAPYSELSGTLAALRVLIRHDLVRVVVPGKEWEVTERGRQRAAQLAAEAR